MILSSVVRAFVCGAMGRRIDPTFGGPIELYLVTASARRLVQQRPWYVQSCLWDGAYKRTLAAISERVAHVAAACFLSRYLNGPLPYVRRHITVNKIKCVECVVK